MKFTARIGVAVVGAALLALPACTTITCIQTSPRDPQIVGKWEVTVENVEPGYVCNPAGIELPPSTGQHVIVADSTGSRRDVMQPIPDHYQLNVGQHALLVADRGRLWVQPVDYPLPPGFKTPPAPAPASVTGYQSKVRLEHGAGWAPTPLTDAMRNSGIIFAAHELTLDFADELRAFRRSDITDLMAFAASRRDALASILNDPKSSAVVPVTVGGRPAMHFEVEGISRKGPISLGYVGTVVQGEVEIAYLVAWTPAAAFPSKKDELAHLADAITGL